MPAVVFRRPVAQLLLLGTGVTTAVLGGYVIQAAAFPFAVVIFLGASMGVAIASVPVGLLAVVRPRQRVPGLSRIASVLVLVLGGLVVLLGLLIVSDAAGGPGTLLGAAVVPMLVLVPVLTFAVVPLALGNLVAGTRFVSWSSVVVAWPLSLWLAIGAVVVLDRPGVDPGLRAAVVPAAVVTVVLGPAVCGALVEVGRARM